MRQGKISELLDSYIFDRVYLEHISISEGNKKIGRTPNISLPPIVSCVNCEVCYRKCYAMKAYRLYPDAKRAWDRNLEIASNEPDRFFMEIGMYLDLKKPGWFRWHVSGDILSQDYLYRMCRLARLFRKTKFCAFTKRFDLDFEMVHVPSNFIVTFSMWPGLEKPLLQNGVTRYCWMDNGMEKRIPVNHKDCELDCEGCRFCWSKSKNDLVIKQH